MQSVEHIYKRARTIRMEQTYDIVRRGEKTVVMHDTADILEVTCVYSDILDDVRVFIDPIHAFAKQNISSWRTDNEKQWDATIALLQDDQEALACWLASYCETRQEKELHNAWTCRVDLDYDKWEHVRLVENEDDPDGYVAEAEYENGDVIKLPIDDYKGVYALLKTVIERADSNSTNVEVQLIFY